MSSRHSVIFMGTPEFAVPALEALHENDNPVLMVVTQPDKPKGRGRKIAPPPVKQAAQEFGYDIFQPPSFKTEEFLTRVQHLKPDFFVVVAFGHILPQRLLDIPHYGAINIHASLLPAYRGPAPIQWAIINGEPETGVTTMLMDKGMDTGDILLAKTEEIRRTDTSRSLHDRLSKMGADVLLQTMESMVSGKIQPKPQDHSRATVAPMLSKEDGRINWEKPAEALDCFIRGMNPWPGAFTFHGEKRLKVFQAKPVDAAVDEPPGTVLKTFPDELRLATGNGVLSILEIQGASGKRLSAKEFLRGYDLPPGTVLS